MWVADLWFATRQRPEQNLASDLVGRYSPLQCSHRRGSGGRVCLWRLSASSRRVRAVRLAGPVLVRVAYRCVNTAHMASAIEIQMGSAIQNVFLSVRLVAQAMSFKYAIASLSSVFTGLSFSTMGSLRA